MIQVEVREGARRQHRGVALYASLQCWVRGLDGIVICKNDFERLIGLAHFKATRVKWIMEDMAELFPHQWLFRLSDTSHLGHLLLSRKIWRNGYGNLEGEMANCNRQGVAVKHFKLWDKFSLSMASLNNFPVAPLFSTAGNPDEKLLTAYLSLVAGGLVPLRSIPHISYESLPAAPVTI